jgi:hypothetical protein
MAQHVLPTNKSLYAQGSVGILSSTVSASVSDCELSMQKVCTAIADLIELLPSTIPPYSERRCCSGQRSFS